MVVYSIKNYSVYRVGNGHIVHNTEKNFKEAHTHIKSFKYAKQLVHNMIYKKKPKTRNLYLLESHRRISGDSNYTDMIGRLMEKKRNGKEHYINVNKGLVKK